MNSVWNSLTVQDFVGSCSFLSSQNTHTHTLTSQIYFCQETLHVSGSSSAHHQEYSTVHSALVYVMEVWWLLSSTTRSCLKAAIKPAWHIPVPNVQWKPPDDGQRNCPKHVEFLDKNKFGKLVRLLVLLKKKFLTMHSHMNVKNTHTFLSKSV